MPSLERCSPSSALSQEVLSAPELPGADCTLQKRRSLQRLKEQPASTSPTTSPKRVIIDSLTFLTRKGYAIHDSSGLPASKNAPTKLSALKWGPKIHSTKSVEIEGCVEVRCLAAVLHVPLEPGTTPVDIIAFAANAFPERINMTSSAVLECAATLGLERRLRSYEYVCDVKNSWNQDQQNWLRIDNIDQTIPQTSLSNAPLGDYPFLLSHSSHPKGGIERWITLSASGQVLANNRANYDPKTPIFLCHLAEFDIYTFIESKTIRHTKPLGRFCYVLKSQRRPDLYTVGENLIHYFATEDQQLATRFYELTNRWRSSYLVDRSHCRHY